MWPTRFAARAVLAGRQTQPGGKLAAALELVTIANHRQHGAGRGLANALEAHELLRTAVLSGHLRDVFVVLPDALVEVVQFAEQVAHGRVGPAFSTPKRLPSA